MGSALPSGYQGGIAVCCGGSLVMEKGMKKKRTMEEVKKELAMFTSPLLGSQCLGDVKHYKSQIRKLNEELSKMREKIYQQGKLFAVLLLVFCAVPAMAASKEVPVYLVSVSGPNSLTPTEAGQLFAELQANYAVETGIYLKLYRHRALGAYPFKSKLTVADSKNDLRRWVGYFQRRLTTSERKRVLFLALVPPYWDTFAGKKAYWMLGWANGICQYPGWNPVAFSTGEMWNLEGRPRLNMSLVAAKHEAAHLLGAAHDDSMPASAMHSNACAYQPEAGPILPFSIKSVSQIRNCLRLK